ncbi:MAG: pyruvate:ferredoxin (flavodoxin) oxidoreductase, partial [Negativibacillus massiliensis]|nr:pyruvate:ferredoxin (flavodoxin) oxidoreductase [Negativibacillus massiliensis]
FRTSHEIQKIEVWDYEDLKEMCDMDAVEAFRKRALNPEHPTMRGSHENGDIFFQHREACNEYYNAVPAVVEEYMGKVNAKLGTNYQLFNYYGAPDADRVIVAMGSICDVAEEVIDYLTAKGEKVGLVKVRLFRPFSAKHLLAAIPETATKIAVLDRTKEPGAYAEPLHLDVMSAMSEAGRQATIIGGRYGLGSKDTTPASIFAVYEELSKEAPKARFTLGINDDVTHLSLEEKEAPNTAAEGTIECKFWGLGGDGTVGANKNSIKIIGDHTNKYVQAYFQYDSKKTGGITISHLRFGDKPIKSPYYINKADFVACHNPSYVTKGYKMVRDVKPGGVFLINCQWTPEELNEHMPAEAKRYIAKNNIQLYTINAIDKAIEIGLGKRTNTILQSAFFALAGVLPKEDAINYMKDAATRSFSKKGEAIVKMNHDAIDAGFDYYVKIDVPADWANAEDKKVEEVLPGNNKKLINMVQTIMEPVAKMDGDSLPVSAFVDHADGTFEQGAAAYEKRGVAVMVPVWDETKCIQCNRCSYVCPHATIRPFALSEEEVANAPAGLQTAKMIGKGLEEYRFTMAVSPMDCMGCGVCVGECPAKEKAITMVPRESQESKQPVFDYLVANVSKKPGMPAKETVKGSQFEKPLLEFSGSCAGCAETAYARLITQLFGDRMYISNATGCSSIWGGPAATSPYTVNEKGHGPAWANSLFEDNAEHGFGMYLGQKVIRERLIEKVRDVVENGSNEAVKVAGQKYLDTVNNGKENQAATEELIAALEACGCDKAKEILSQKEYLSKKSVWVFGGDGWAYDIGFGGVDHVLASGEDINIMVFDTEVYSNTGGQASKASQIGQVAQFAAAGKAIAKKSLAEIAMSYGYIYVAQIAMGADMNQTIKAIAEAEAYPGPSLIIGYAPCEMHSIKGGMTNCQKEMKRAVDCGYWNMFRFNPALKAEGKNPFTLDSKAPTTDYKEFILGEARYSSLTRAFPERAEALFEQAAQNSRARYEHLVRLGELYAAK